jgi:ATP-dependent DNA ligase
VPLEQRKANLADLLAGKHGEGPIIYCDHVVDGGEHFLWEVQARGLEGMISKRRTSRYRGGPSRSWLKVKCRSDRERFLR